MNGTNLKVGRAWIAAYEWTPEATRAWDGQRMYHLLQANWASFFEIPLHWDTLLAFRRNTPIIVLTSDKEMGVGFLERETALEYTHKWGVDLLGLVLMVVHPEIVEGK